MPIQLDGTQYLLDGKPAGLLGSTKAGLVGWARYCTIGVGIVGWWGAWDQSIFGSNPLPFVINVDVDGTVHVLLENEGTSMTWDSAPGAVEADKRTCLIVWFDAAGPTLKVWVGKDGVISNVTAGGTQLGDPPGFPATNLNALSIGSSDTGGGDPADGAFSDLAVFDNVTIDDTIAAELYGLGVTPNYLTTSIKAQHWFLPSAIAIDLADHGTASVGPARFNGTSQFIFTEFGDTQTGNPFAVGFNGTVSEPFGGAEAVTLEFVFTPDATGGARQTLAICRNGPGAADLDLEVAWLRDTEKIEFRRGNGTTAALVRSAANTFPDGETAFLLCSMPDVGGSLHICKNGVELAVDVVSSNAGAFLGTGGGLTIGANWTIVEDSLTLGDSATNFFKGTIHRFVMWLVAEIGTVVGAATRMLGIGPAGDPSGILDPPNFWLALHGDTVDPLAKALDWFAYATMLWFGNTTFDTPNTLTLSSGPLVYGDSCAGGGADTDPPVMSNRVPDNGDVDVPRNTNIAFRVTDVGSGVASSSLNVTVSGVPAITGGVFQAGFNGPASLITPVTDGFDVVIDPTSLLVNFNTVTVAVTVNDNA